MDTSGLINLSDNQWSIDYWVAHKSELISPSMIPNIHQSFSTEFPCITTEFNVDDITIKNESILSSLPKSDNLLISKFTLHNTAPYPISFSFFIAIRPYNLEGISPLNSLSYLSEQAFIVNDNLGILLDKKPDNIVCLNFEDGDVCEYYNKWEMILQSTCNRGLATGFAEYRVTLQENETTSFQITCPVKEYTYKNSPKNLGKTKQKRLKNYIDNIKRIHFDNESTNLFGQWTKYKKNLLEFNFPESSLTSFIKQASIHLLSATKKSFPYKNQENIYLYLTALHSIGKSDIAHKLIQSIYPKKLSLFYLRKHSLENCGYLIDILMNDIYYNFNERKLLMHQPKTTSLANYVISDKAKKRSFMDFANTLHIISSAIYVLQDTQNESEVKKMTIAYKKYSSELETYLNNFEEKIAFQPILPISNTEFHDTRLINGLRSIYPQEVLSRNNFRISHTLQYINDHFLYENSIVSIEVGTTYNELGASATDNYDDNSTITSTISISGSVNTATLGSYTVSYDVTDSSGNSASTLIRTINVVDTTIPVLSLLGSSPVNIELNGAYTDDGATATDNYDDNATLTAQINLSGTVDNTVVGSYTLTYNVSDSSNNQATPISRVVNVEDNIKPVITLLGDSTISIQPEESRVIIRRKVAEALKGNLQNCIWKHPQSFLLRIRFIKQQVAYRASHYEGAKLIDAKTVQYETSDYDNIMRFILFTV